LATGGTTAFVKENFRLQCLRFGVLAPKTGEGTAFEEDGRPNPGAVMNGISLDIEDDSSRLFSGLRFFHHTWRRMGINQVACSVLAMISF
jgi:hypothetical protein